MRKLPSLDRRLTRRRVLSGLGGICVALPFLELFYDRDAKAAPGDAPLRYLIAFGGSSLGMDGRDMVVPDSEGPLAGQLTRALLPLADFGVEDDFSIVTGLNIPFGADGNIPAGGRAIQWHSSSKCPQLCGVRSAESGDEKLTGPTSDWIVAETIGGPTLDTRPVLTYRVQPAFYRGTNGTGGNRGLMSARMNGNQLEQVNPQFSPQAAFQDLFTGFIPPDPEEAAEATFLLERRKSIIDLVAKDAEALVKKLGAADKQRLERHLDELRALENKLSSLTLPNGSACELLDDPGPDPEIGGAVENGDTGGYAANGAWSDEETRATVLIDLIHMAFACDLSRVSSLMFTYAQCFMNMNPTYGHPSDLHELGHYSVGGGDAGANAVADGVAWHVKHIARLVDKLKNTTDLDGTNLLDNTAIVLTFEGGWGFDPEQNNEGSAHSSENMAVLVAGRAGGLNPTGGKHIRAVGEHPARIINTVMGALGVPGQLGEVSGTIPELLT
jgi:hypothetical protein